MTTQRTLAQVLGVEPVGAHRTNRPAPESARDALARIVDDVVEGRAEVARLREEVAADGSRPEAWRRQTVAQLDDALRAGEREAAQHFDTVKTQAIRDRQASLRAAAPLPAGTAGTNARLDRLNALLAAQEWRARLADGTARRQDVASAALTAQDEGQWEAVRALVAVADGVVRDPNAPRSDEHRMTDRLLQAVSTALQAHEQETLPPETRQALAEIAAMEALRIPPAEAEIRARYKLGTPAEVSFTPDPEAEVAGVATEVRAALGLTAQAATE